ncbi:acyl-CoA dehydrogenase [Streptomyces sp. WAC 06738]|uniref:acyl-CoA dehydrogenase family protein n=1 Tax=Streptomyces sp. WAC 06738 TaxID=2203210 RepID=UPI000F70946B|nr:acyl-CoA dehydrogenase family protein [Streptomyces sp. WAC 06738]AZM44483.1 acyl-CoA dehydrogenase [Streptomyces sp. WAC 06738]
MIAWSKDDERLREGIDQWFGKFGQDFSCRDGEAAFPRESWLAVMESGLLRLPFDERWGGLGRSLLTTMYVLEELGRGCPDSALNFAITTHMVSTGIALQRFGSTALKDAYLPRITAGTAIGAHAVAEPDSGSDALGMRTAATADGDCYRLSGSKAFVGNGPVADLVVVYAKTEPAAGPLGITAFLVERDTPGLTFGGPTEETGAKSPPLCSLVLDDCRVPRTHILGRVGAGSLVLDHVMTWEILCCFIVSAGEMRRRLDRCVAYAGERSAVGDFPPVARRIVDMKIGLETSRKWLYDTAEKFTAGRKVTADLAIAKLVAGRAALDSAMAEYGLEEELRSAPAVTFHSGTAETQYHRIAATLGLGRAA